MNKRYLIPFLLCISVLILSEYFLLTEVYSQKRRILVLVVSTVSLFASILIFWFYYRRFREAANQPI